MAEIYPLQILLATVAGWMNRRQGEIFEYLVEENRVLRALLERIAFRRGRDGYDPVERRGRAGIFLQSSLGNPESGTIALFFLGE